MLNAFRTDTKLSSRETLVLNVLPFILFFAAYFVLTYVVHWLALPEANQAVQWLSAQGIDSPNPRLLPLPSDIWQSFLSSLKPDSAGHVQLTEDVCATLRRFTIGLSISTLFAIPLGLFTLFPKWREFWVPILGWFDKVQALLLWPILLLFLGLDEAPKIAIVIVGVLPGIALEIARLVELVKKDQIYKAQTLGATEMEVVWHVVYRQIFPLIIAAIAATFKAAWGYVIAAEMSVASCGIGYRIFLAKRLMDMPTILAYVIVAMLIMFAADLLFGWWRRSYRWANQ